MTSMTPVLWERALASIRSAVGPEAFESWLSTLGLEDFDDQARELTLSVPNVFYRNWIEKRYMNDIRAIFEEELGEEVAVTLMIKKAEEAVVAAPRRVEVNGRHPLVSAGRGSAPDDTVSSRRPVADATEDDLFHAAESARATTSRRAPVEDPDLQSSPRLNPRYVFDEFVVGESNRYAHAAGIAVSDPKGKAFNPLFIYGGSGLGKTHLMQAIGHKMYAADQRLKIIYVTSEQFINGFIDAIQNKRHMEFRASYRNVDLLLIDDVQFLMGKERTQQEFFHTFNALYDAGKKVVVTSDRPPRDLSTLEERLRSRFEWGLLVDIQQPDLETRIAILRKKAETEGIRLPNDVIFFIAERVTTNIREMEGTLKRLKMAASLHDRPMDLETARDVLGHLVIGAPAERVTVDDVQRVVCTYFGIKGVDLLGTNRSKKFSQPRHLAQYLCRKLTELSFPDIAQKFGGKDHTSIIYACKKVEAGIVKDPNLANIVAYLTKQVTKGSDQ